VNNEFVSRRPGESTEQWLTRASAEYRSARDALSVELRAGYPVLDEGYDGAMDRLEAADIEHADAAHALDRERGNNDRVGRMRPTEDARMTPEPSVDPSRRPVYANFRDVNNEIHWARFRAAVTAWDAARTVPAAAPDPANQLPPT